MSDVGAEGTSERRREDKGLRGDDLGKQRFSLHICLKVSRVNELGRAS